MEKTSAVAEGLAELTSTVSEGLVEETSAVAEELAEARLTEDVWRENLRNSSKC